MSVSPPVPIIEISLAPPEEPQPEPYSPFTPMNSGFPSAAGRDADVNDDAYRPALLTPPPLQSWSLSQRRPLSVQPKNKGLRDEEFQALLRASRERGVTASARKQDLRKEVALKAHKTRQLERRALFLSKIGAPPSPTATSLPKTPPDSPAIFHYSLPSPGLCSPLALFEKLGLDDQDAEERGARKVWVEQVDFRLPRQPEPVSLSMSMPTIVRQSAPTSEVASRYAQPQSQFELPSITVTTAERPQQDKKGHARKRSIPSLEEITERYSAQASGGATTVAAASPTPARARAPLPAFLNVRRQSPPPPPPVEVPEVKVIAPESMTRPRLTCTGRIQFPSRSPSPPSSKPLPALPSEPAPLMMRGARQRTNALPPLPTSPRSPSPPSLQITITHVPRTESTSPVQLTEANLYALNSRAATARDMLSTIRRRTVVSYGRVCIPPPKSASAFVGGVYEEEDEKQRRRHSAPADMPSKGGRTGFSHPVLAHPSGF